MRPLQPGDPPALGRYTIIARLGAGGMAWVFLGRTRGGRTVAVKAIRPEFAQDPEFRLRFRQEVEAIRRVEGRFTSAVVDADPDAPMPWLAMSFVPGLSLKEVVSGGWLLPESSLKALAAGLAQALLEIQRAGLVHRDLKPSNVIVTVDGPRVIDFGISRAADNALTRTGVLIGSPGFMSPEQALGRPLTPASDVFSLGAVLAYAATGRNPFGEGQDHVMLYRISHVEPTLDDVPDSLLPLVAACLAKEPGRRPTANEILRQSGGVPHGSWLPADLTAVIARSATEVLDYESLVVLPPSDGERTVYAQRTQAPTHLATPPMEPSATRRIPMERVAAPVLATRPEQQRRRGRGAVVFFALCFAAILGAALTTVVLNRHNQQLTPPASGTSTILDTTPPVPTSSQIATSSRESKSATPSATPTPTKSSATATPTATATTPTPTATSSSATPTPSRTPSQPATTSATAPPTTTAPPPPTTTVATPGA